MSVFQNTDANRFAHSSKQIECRCLHTFNRFNAQQTLYVILYPLRDGCRSYSSVRKLTITSTYGMFGCANNRKNTFLSTPKSKISTSPSLPIATHALKCLRRSLRRETFRAPSPSTLRLVWAHNRAPSMPPPHRRTRRLFSAHRP